MRPACLRVRIWMRKFESILFSNETLSCLEFSSTGHIVNMLQPCHVTFHIPSMESFKQKGSELEPLVFLAPLHCLVHVTQEPFPLLAGPWKTSRSSISPDIPPSCYWNFSLSWSTRLLMLLKDLNEDFLFSKQKQAKESKSKQIKKIHKTWISSTSPPPPKFFANPTLRMKTNYENISKELGKIKASFQSNPIFEFLKMFSAATFSFCLINPQ